MTAQRTTVGLAKGMKGKPGPGRGNVGQVRTRVSEAPTLDDAGIDKHLAHRARKLAAVPAAPRCAAAGTAIGSCRPLCSVCSAIAPQAPAAAVSGWFTGR